MMESTKIIRVLHFVSCMNRAGQETFIMNMYRKIDRSKIQFCFLCTNSAPADYDNEIITMGGHIYYLPYNKYNSGIKKYINDIRILTDWLIQNRTKFDIVHLHTYHASDALIHLEACRRAKIEKRIVHSHNTQGPHAIFHRICSLLCSFYDYNKFACGKAAAKWMYGSFLKNVKVILNGIDTHAFMYSCENRNIYRSSLGIDNKTVIGHIGRFNYQKNHRLIIEIFYQYHKLNKDSVLLLVGSGELQEEIRKNVIDLGIEKYVLFLGIRDDIPNLLSAMDIFLFPSLHEGLSVCSIEVQANGLPIITSDIQSMHESNITDRMYFIPLNSNISNWVKHIQKCEHMKRLNNAHEVVKAKGYDVSSIANNLCNTYVKIYYK